jgi:hypothetical protein
MRFFIRSTAAAGVVAAITLAGQAAASAAAGPAAAARPDGGPGHWSQVTGLTTGSAEIGLVRGADGILHIIWVTGSLRNEKIMDTPVAPDGAVGKATTIASGQSGASSPGATATPSGLDAFWISGLELAGATRPARGGRWTAGNVTREVNGGTSVTAATGSDGRPWVSWTTTFQLALLHLGQSQDNVRTPCCTYDPGIATDGVTGASYVAYLALIDHANGIWVRRLSKTAVTGTASRLPGTVTGGNTVVLDQRVAITGRGSGRAGVYASYPAGWPSAGALDVYRIGAGKPFTLATVNPLSADIFGTDITAGPNGRLWDAWIVKTNPEWEVFVRASNPAATAWSPAAKVALPRGTQFVDQVYESAQASKVDLVALLQISNHVAFYATQVPFPVARK